MEYLLLIVWFWLLIKWADLLVDWSASIASKLWISSLVIWLTVVAFWTSAPEFVVSFMSASYWKTDLAISNIIWSNIANIALILWVTAFISPIKMPRSTVKKEIPFAIIITIVLLLLIKDASLWVVDWVVLLLFFIWFLFYTYQISRNNNWQEIEVNKNEVKEIKNQESEIKDISKLKSIIFIVLWLSGLIFWGNLIVDNAVKIAESFWLSNAFIWVTIIAIWTSLPELASSIMAALKKNSDIAIWAIVWSNIFNILWILGFSSLFFDLKSYPWANIDLMVSLFLSILLVIFSLIHRKYFLDRWNWVIFIMLYAFYIWYLVINI